MGRAVVKVAAADKDEYPFPRVENVLTAALASEDFLVLRISKS